MSRFLLVASLLVLAACRAAADEAATAEPAAEPASSSASPASEAAAAKTTESAATPTRPPQGAQDKSTQPPLVHKEDKDEVKATPTSQKDGGKKNAADHRAASGLAAVTAAFLLFSAM